MPPVRITMAIAMPRLPPPHYAWCLLVGGMVKLFLGYHIRPPDMRLASAGMVVRPYTHPPQADLCVEEHIFNPKEISFDAPPPLTDFCVIIPCRTFSLPGVLSTETCALGISLQESGVGRVSWHGMVPIPLGNIFLVMCLPSWEDASGFCRYQNPLFLPGEEWVIVQRYFLRYRL